MSNDFELPKDVETKGTKKAAVETQNQFAQSDEITADNKPRYSEEELAKIFDEIIFSGVYSEQVVIKGKLRITLRTRTAEETEEITQKLDATGANLISTLDHKRALLNIYYALTSYQGKDVGMMKLEEREKFVNKIPAPIISAIVIALSKFDTKVYEACRDGEENF